MKSALCMVRGGMAILSLLSSTAFSEVDTGPGTICDRIPGCTAQMTRIAGQFSVGDATFLASESSAYSGSCFHLNPIYDANKTHHAGFVFDVHEHEISVSGLFSFFADENPYAGLTPAELRTVLSAGGRPASAQRGDDELTLEFITPASEIIYWFRSDASARNLALIGRQVSDDFQSAVFCELQRHL